MDLVSSTSDDCDLQTVEQTEKKRGKQNAKTTKRRVTERSVSSVLEKNGRSLT